MYCSERVCSWAAICPSPFFFVRSFFPPWPSLTRIVLLVSLQAAAAPWERAPVFCRLQNFVTKVSHKSKDRPRIQPSAIIHSRQLVHCGRVAALHLIDVRRQCVFSGHTWPYPGLETCNKCSGGADLHEAFFTTWSSRNFWRDRFVSHSLIKRLRAMPMRQWHKACNWNEMKWNETKWKERNGRKGNVTQHYVQFFVALVAPVISAISQKRNKHRRVQKPSTPFWRPSSTLCFASITVVISVAWPMLNSARARQTVKKNRKGMTLPQQNQVRKFTWCLG